MRNINRYFSEKYEKDIPCYKKSINICKELNEFDYELEDKYNGTLLENDKYYITYYQIDKSSETYLINSYLEFNFLENEKITNEHIEIIKFYINDQLSEINEVPTISIDKFDRNSIAFEIRCFKDNIIIDLDYFLMDNKFICDCEIYSITCSLFELEDNLYQNLLNENQIKNNIETYIEQKKNCM